MTADKEKMRIQSPIHEARSSVKRAKLEQSAGGFRKVHNKLCPEHYI